MKKIIYTLAALTLVLCTVACNKSLDTVEVTGDENKSKIIVNIKGFPAASPSDDTVKSLTKGEGDTKYQTTVEKKVSQVDIVIYDESGAKEWNRHFDGAPMSHQLISGLTEGAKTVAVLANYTLDSVPATITAFKETLTSLADNSRDNFVMVGVAEGTAGTDPEPVSLKLVRVAAKVSVTGNIITAWEGEAPESFDITDIYLANVAVASDFDYDGSSGPEINLRSTVELVADSLYNDFTVAVKKNWTDGDQFNGGVEFYAYPNSDDVRTCVMIKALYDGRVTYYPLVINLPIAQNTLYRIGDITITCEGCENPWDEFSKIRVFFDIEVADWDYKEIYPEYTF